MTSKIRLGSTESYARAQQAILSAPAGSTVRIEPPRRSVDQNRMIHSIIREWIKTIPLPSGQMMEDSEDNIRKMKVALLNAWGAEIEEFPSPLDGSILPLTPHTSALSKSEMGSFIDWVLAEAAHRGHPIKVQENAYDYS